MSTSDEAGSGCLHFDYDELKKATNGFDTRPIKNGGCKLGEGGFGPVFKGKLKFTDVAIKILRNTPKVRHSVIAVFCFNLPLSTVYSGRQWSS